MQRCEQAQGAARLTRRTANRPRAGARTQPHALTANCHAPPAFHGALFG
jgi:hypothetical protein